MKTQRDDETTGKAEVRRIGILRALDVGDLMCAVPAFRALRRAYPEARITLIGLPWAEQWVARSPFLDDFIAFPGWPGLPERAVVPAELPRFLQTMQAQGFDWLLQMHGSGLVTNPLMGACGARRLAGFAAPPAWCPDAADFVPWPEEGREVEGMLALMDRLGVPRQGLRLGFPISDEDRQALGPLLQGLAPDVPLAVLHMGNRQPLRRWLPERFAHVGDALAGRGHAIVLAGTEADKPLGMAVAQLMKAPTLNLVGRTSLWTLGALLERAALLVCHDTRVSHIASALDTPSVVISIAGDAPRWSPPEATHHPILWETPEDDDPSSSATHQPGVQGAAAVEHVLAAVQALENLRP